MSTDHLLPGCCNPDACVATSAMNRPRLFTHWIPNLQVRSYLGFTVTYPNHLHSQTLNEKSLLQLRQQPAHSRLKFIDDYLEDARRAEDKVYSFESPWTPESTHNRDNTTIPELAENISTGVALPSSADPSSPRSHLPRLVTNIHIVPYSQISNDSPTSFLSSVSSIFSEAMAEDSDSCPPESLIQKSSTSRDDAGVPSLGDPLSASMADS